ncbi:hypothetical protein GCM10020331_023250 [Ectobacillus funiculus]
MFVIGCSTSEVIGSRIGTAGTIEVAQILFEELRAFQDKTGISLVFQCCEHLNRALVVEREVAQKYNLEMVTVIPVRSAGGALPTYAYHNMKDPVVVEFIKADAGIDIGDTFIGMHIKHVAVPVRTALKQIGSAHVTLAKNPSETYRRRPRSLPGSTKGKCKLSLIGHPQGWPFLFFWRRVFSVRMEN